MATRKSASTSEVAAVADRPVVTSEKNLVSMAFEAAWRNERSNKPFADGAALNSSSDAAMITPHLTGATFFLSMDSAAAGSGLPLAVTGAVTSAATSAI